jgi:hypothetical protein
LKENFLIVCLGLFFLLSPALITSASPHEQEMDMIYLQDCDITDLGKVRPGKRGDIPMSPSPSNSLWENYMGGDEQYPVVGKTSYGLIYLDRDSITATEKNGALYLSCLVYYGSGGMDDEGNILRTTERAFRFRAHRDRHGRKKFELLLAVNTDTQRDESSLLYDNDNGFLYHLLQVIGKERIARFFAAPSSQNRDF